MQSTKYYSKSTICGNDLVEYVVGDIVSVMLNSLELITGKVTSINETGFSLDNSKEFDSKRRFVDFRDVKVINLYFGE